MIGFMHIWNVRFSLYLLFHLFVRSEIWIRIGYVSEIDRVLHMVKRLGNLWIWHMVGQIVMVKLDVSIKNAKTSFFRS